MGFDMVFSAESVLFVGGLVVLALWQRKVFLYVAAILATLLAAAQWTAESWTYAGPTYVLSLYMTYRLAAHYWSKRGA